MTSNFHGVNKITVLLADDHTIVRAGLRMMLDGTSNIQVVGEAENGRQAVRLAERLKPDVVVMDVVMPELNGVEATRQILRNAPKTKVLVLSSYKDEEQVAESIRHGAMGYLVKQAAANDLVKAIHEVKKGQAFFGAGISKVFFERCGEFYPKRWERELKPNHLTVRENQVLRLIAEGNGNKQMADALCISIKTVEKHRQSVMDKLEIHDTAGLTRYAVARGMIEVTDPRASFIGPHHSGEQKAA